MDGLVWKTEYKKELMFYNIYKLRIGCVIEDEKVSVDDLEVSIADLEEYV